MSSFRKFIETEGRKLCDTELLDRITRPGAPAITTLTALLKFAKERWPDDNPSDYRKSDASAPHSREAMRKLWGAYLEWTESAPEKKPALKAAGG